MYVDVHGRDRDNHSSFARSSSPGAMASSRRVVVDNPRQIHPPDQFDPPFSGRNADASGGSLASSLRGARGADSMDFQHSTRHVAVPVTLAVNASSSGRRVRPATLDERFRAISAIREEQERKKREQQEEEERQIHEKQIHAATQARLAAAVERQREARLAKLDARRRSWQTNGQNSRQGIGGRQPSTASAPATVKRDQPGSVVGATRVNPPVRDRLGSASAGKGTNAAAKGSIKDRIKIPIANRLSFGDSVSFPAATAPQAPSAISTRLSFGTQLGTPAQLLPNGGAAVAATFMGPSQNTRSAKKKNNAAFGAAVFGLGQSQGLAGASRPQRKGQGSNVKAAKGRGHLAKGKKEAQSAVTFDKLDEDLDSYWSKKGD